MCGAVLPNKLITQQLTINDIARGYSSTFIHIKELDKYVEDKSIEVYVGEDCDITAKRIYFSSCVGHLPMHVDKIIITNTNTPSEINFKNYGSETAQ